MAISMSDAEWNKLIEAVGVLAGWRGDKEKSQAAVRRADLQNIDTLLNTLKGGSTSIETQLKAIRQQLQTLSLGVSSLRTDVDKNTGDISTLQGDLNSLEQSVSTLQQTVNSHGQSISTLTQQVASAQNIATEAQRDIDGTQSRTRAVEIPDPEQGDITAPPTAAQFNGLVADIAAIAQAMTQIKSAIVG